MRYRYTCRVFERAENPLPHNRSVDYSRTTGATLRLFLYSGACCYNLHLRYCPDANVLLKVNEGHT